MGYTGKLLRINLKTSKIDVEAISKEMRRNFLGGSGFAIKYLWDEVSPDVDPLGPENKLIFATGPLTGTPVESSGRAVVASKSPLTGIFGDAHSGSEWGPELKMAGYDMLIIEGRSKKPVYSFISDDQVEIKSAKKIWKKRTTDTLEWIITEHGRIKDRESGKGYTRTVLIGPLGENLSPIACIMAEKHRAFGRCGFGAVMGSKKLKAIVVQGTKDIPISNEIDFNAINENVAKKLSEASVTGTALNESGTAVLVSIISELGLLPGKNFQTCALENVENLYVDNIKQKFDWKTFGCSDYCNIMKCGKYTTINNNRMVVPEYESLFSLGSNCGITDFKVVTQANELCNEYGIDTISAGNVISFAMEYSEKVAPIKLKSGILGFGNGDALLEVLKLMGKNKKVGKDLNLGVQALAEKWNYLEGAITVKKMGLPAYDPRGLRGQALSYVTSTRGGDHLKAYLIAPEVLGTTPTKHDPLEKEGKVDLTILLQDASAVLDSLLICKFVALGIVEDGVTIDDLVALTNADTGEEYTSEEFLQIGTRIYNLERLFNLKSGMTGSADTLPIRLKKPLPDGPHKGETSDLTQLLKEYYEKRGWDDTGKPILDTLKSLGIEEETAS